MPEHNAAIIDQVREITRSLDVGLGDVGILCPSNGQVATVLSLLAAAGIPGIDLLKYQGKPVDAVKVGTIKRAKGLEFKHVLLPWTKRALLTPGVVRDPDGSASLLEREERERRELYVGMTRARDGLWVGTVG